MVKITNGIETFNIPEGAVKTYKSMGFKPVDNKPVDKKHTNDNEGDYIPDFDTVDAGDTGDVYDTLLQKPISQWNQNEVKDFAAAKGYDVSGAKSLKQAKAIIKSALEEEERMLVEG